jgi:hypothetical protein
MRKRRLVILDGVVLLVTVAVGVPVLLLSMPRTPLREKYDRVRVGMKAEEVYAIMGEPLRAVPPSLPAPAVGANTLALLASPSGQGPLIAASGLFPEPLLEHYGQRRGYLEDPHPYMPTEELLEGERASLEFTNGQITRKTWSDGHQPSRLERWLAPIRQALGW